MTHLENLDLPRAEPLESTRQSHLEAIQFEFFIGCADSDRWPRKQAVLLGGIDPFVLALRATETVVRRVLGNAVDPRQ